MPKDPQISRSIGSKGAQVLDEAARRRRRTIRWPADSEWLQEITPAPQKLLNRMRDGGWLYGVGSNRYVLAPAGTASLRQAAPPELMADLALGTSGDYYIGFLSALIAHRLTDLHSELTYVALPKGSRRPQRIPEGFKVAELSPRAWPDPEGGEIERFRVFKGLKEFANRSSPERALVDGLLRPDLSGGIETVVGAWAVAAAKPEVSWDQVARIAERIGGATARRTAFLMGLLHMEDVVERHFADLEGRRTSPVFDRSRGFEESGGKFERDPRTGVIVNVPRSYLRGWISGAASA